MDLGPLTLLQGNINHSAAAQDLLCATAAEWRAGLAIVAEPYYVPPQSDNWLQSTDGTAAIVRVGAGSSPSLGPQGNRGPAVSAAFPRWALTKLRPEVAEEAAMVRAWSDPPAHIAGDVDGMAELFADDMGVVCQAAMPRTRACPDRGQGAAGPGDRDSIPGSWSVRAPQNGTLGGSSGGCCGGGPSRVGRRIRHGEGQAPAQKEGAGAGWCPIAGSGPRPGTSGGAVPGEDVGVKPSKKGDRATSLASPTQMRDVRLSFRDCSGSRSTVDRDRSRSRAGGRSAAVEKTKNKRGLEDNSSSQSWESASCTDSTIDLTSDATTPDNRRQRRRKKLKKKSSGSGSVSGSAIQLRRK
ncbi:hypothetical protein ACJJTC_000061 [Scirpophaga incertulas]